MRSEIYVSTDVEADGPIPGPHSMLSFASAAFVLEMDEGGRQPVGFREAGSFSRNLETLPGAAGAAETMAFWRDHPAAWEATRLDPRPPEAALREYVAWLTALEHEAVPGRRLRPVFVAYPAGFDFSFVHWYLVRYAGRSPFGFAALDVKSYAMAVLRTSFRGAAKSRFPREWFGPQRHTHVALDDAREQGELFCRMLIAHHGGPPPSPQA